MATHATRRSFLRLALMSVSGVAAGGLLSACAPKVVTQTVVVEKQVEKVVEVVKEAEVAPKTPATVRYHARIGEQENALYEMQSVKFMEENPHITLVLENFPGGEYLAKISTMFAGGTLGDAIWGAIGGATVYFLYSQGLVRPHDEFVAAEGHDILSEYYDGCIKAMQIEGNLLGLPFKAHPGLAIIYYNMNLFEKAGIDVPTPEWKHDDQVEMAQAIQGVAGADPIYGYLPGTDWKAVLTMTRSFGGDLVGENGTKFLLNSDEGKEAVRRLHSFFQTWKVSPTPEQVIGGGNQMWTMGLLGMIQGGTSTAVLEKTIGDKFKWMAAPNAIGPAGVGGSDYEVDSYSVTTSSKQPWEAWEWVKYLCNRDSGILLGVIGGTVNGRHDVYDSPVLLRHPYRVVFRDVMANAQDWNIQANWRLSESASALGQLLQPLWAGQEQPTDAFIDSVTEQIQDIFDMPRP
jgi:ABC-type glycerol-3-phosphate transport system substrate-binding protein